MEPVFQRLGDVTIQRLERPKENKPQEEPVPSEDKSEDEASTAEEQELSGEEFTAPKRSLDTAGPSNKRFKLDLSNVTVTKKSSDENSLLNFSDNELSDYETESELESEGEEIPEGEGEVPKIKEEPDTSFLEQLVDEPFEGPSETQVEPESTAGDAEDYDYDIKEKLKEMGEISFETVKKGEPKPKKVEPVVENEVIVTPAKKPGKGKN